MKKAQQLKDDLDDKLTEAKDTNQELTYKLHESKTIAKEDALVHDMIMKQHQEEFSQLKKDQEVEISFKDEQISQIKTQFEERER